MPLRCKAFQETFLQRCQMIMHRLVLHIFFGKKSFFTSKSPIKSCGYAPYIMFLIERVTKKTFIKEIKHEPYRMRPLSIKAPSLSPSPPHVPPSVRKTTSRRAPSHGSSFIKSALKAIFNVCNHNVTQIKEQMQY
jgi:hypothetical protein